MRVLNLNLRCSNDHDRQDEFASDGEFMDQNGRGVVECPLCGGKVVGRIPSTPRVNLSGAQQPAPPQAAWLQAGAQAARRAAYSQRALRRGSTPHSLRSPGECATPRNEGTEVVSLPVPRALNGPVR